MAFMLTSPVAKKDMMYGLVLFKHMTGIATRDAATKFGVVENKGFVKREVMNHN